jgi:hypothetical protein
MTSIEFLKDWMSKNQYFIGNDLLEAFEQAKEMHKQEIIDSRENGISEGYRRTNNFYYDKMIDSEQYYQKTFVSKRSDDKEMERKLLKSGFVDIVPKQETLYTKEDVLKAGEIGEINHYDYKHIVSLLDEAKAINQSLKQPKKD